MGICVISERKYSSYKSDLDCDFLYGTVEYFVWSVAVDYCSLYFHFSVDPGSSIMYELQLVLAIVHY